MLRGHLETSRGILGCLHWLGASCGQRSIMHRAPLLTNKEYISTNTWQCSVRKPGSEILSRRMYSYTWYVNSDLMIGTTWCFCARMDPHPVVLCEKQPLQPWVTYLEESEGCHPASTDLLILSTEQTQLLHLNFCFVWLEEKWKPHQCKSEQIDTQCSEW